MFYVTISYQLLQAEDFVLTWKDRYYRYRQDTVA